MPSMVNVSPVHYSPDLHQMEGPLTEVTHFNIPQHVLPQSPLAPIGEHPQVTGFTLSSSSTPYEPLSREPPPGYPIASPSRGAPSTFMELLSRMIHLWLETPHTPSCMQGPSTFREPYLVAQPPTAPVTFVHSPDPRTISGDSPLVATTQRFTLTEEDTPLAPFSVLPAPVAPPSQAPPITPPAIPPQHFSYPP